MADLLLLGSTIDLDDALHLYIFFFLSFININNQKVRLYIKMV